LSKNIIPPTIPPKFNENQGKKQDFIATLFFLITLLENQYTISRLSKPKKIGRGGNMPEEEKVNFFTKVKVAYRNLGSQIDF
jgi:hypothetical protein